MGYQGHALGRFVLSGRPTAVLHDPFGLHDDHVVRRLLEDAGFSAVAHQAVDLMGQGVSARLAAEGLVLGSPVLHAIHERGTVSPDVIVDALAARLVEAGGESPMRLPTRAIVFNARA